MEPFTGCSDMSGMLNRTSHRPYALQKYSLGWGYNEYRGIMGTIGKHWFGGVVALNFQYTTNPSVLEVEFILRLIECPVRGYSLE